MVSPRLREALDTALSLGRSAWPGICLTNEDFVQWVASKLEQGAPGEALEPALSRLHLHAQELFLACACARRDAAAIAHFERCYMPEVVAVAARFDALPVAREDVLQRMREKLFLRDPPSLAGYAGNGDLFAWVRAASLHLLINIVARESREQPTERAFLEAVVNTSADAEAAYLKEACRVEFEDAFRASIERLTSRERILLRYAFTDQLSVEDIGAIFRVHRATAARWVAKARERLVRGTRAELMNRLRVSEADAASIVRAALSRMGTTLLQRLG